MDQKAASQLVFETLAYAVAGDTERAASGLQTLGAQSDNNGMYGVCCAFAGAGKLMLRRLFGDRAPKTADEGMWVLQQLQPGALDDNPPKTFAMRFLIAYANDDTDTTLALFAAALQAGEEQYVDSVCALLTEVAGITRLARDQAQ